VISTPRAAPSLATAPLLALALTAACTPAPGPAPLPVIIPPAPIAASAAPPASAAPAPSAPPLSPLSLTRRKLATSIDSAAVQAPCDLARAYRGAIGSTKVSLVVHPAAPGADALVGQSHYDREGDGIELTGTRTGNGFRLSEKRGGTFTGTCDPASGALHGSFTFKGKAESFSLGAQPDGWPGLVWVVRRTNIDANEEDPICKTQGSPDMVSEPENADGATVLCLPRDPKKRKALLADADFGRCWVEDQGVRVFGGASPDLDRKVNRVLRDAGGFDGSVKELLRCMPPRSIWTSQRLVELGEGVLVVQVETSNDYGGAHPMNGVQPATGIDLVSGERVELDELVTSVPKLRELVAACLPIFTAANARATFAPPRDRVAKCGDEDLDAGYLWGCPDSLDAPHWSLTTQGIVIGGIGHAHSMSTLDGTGPIIPWAVLAREGLLPEKSRVKRLFDRAPPAAPTDPTCSSCYVGDAWLSWR
jgi:hypothetical protein